MMLFIIINFKSIMLMGTNLISLYFNSELNINLWKGSRTSFIDIFMCFLWVFFFLSHQLPKQCLRQEMINNENLSSKNLLSKTCYQPQRPSKYFITLTFRKAHASKHCQNAPRLTRKFSRPKKSNFQGIILYICCQRNVCYC